MIIGVGVDIAQISRFIDKSEHFINRVLSLKEKLVYDSLIKERKTEYLASRFSAKEAIFKAYNNNIEYNKISVLNNEKGAPFIEMETPYNIHISLSHEIDYVVAYVVVEK